MGTGFSPLRSEEAFAPDAGEPQETDVAASWRHWPRRVPARAPYHRRLGGECRCGGGGSPRVTRSGSEKRCPLIPMARLSLLHTMSLAGPDVQRSTAAVQLSCAELVAQARGANAAVQCEFLQPQAQAVGDWVSCKWQPPASARDFAYRHPLREVWVPTARGHQAAATPACSLRSEARHVTPLNATQHCVWTQELGGHNWEVALGRRQT